MSVNMTVNMIVILELLLFSSVVSYLNSDLLSSK